jgi:hypothetical protein
MSFASIGTIRSYALSCQHFSSQWIASARRVPQQRRVPVCRFINVFDKACARFCEQPHKPLTAVEHSQPGRVLTDVRYSKSRCISRGIAHGETTKAPGHAGSLCLDWLRGTDLNCRPLGYEPNELPDCSTPRRKREFDGVARSPR